MKLGDMVTVYNAEVRATPTGQEWGPYEAEVTATDQHWGTMSGFLQLKDHHGRTRFAHPKQCELSHPRSGAQ